MERMLMKKFKEDSYIEIIKSIMKMNMNLLLNMKKIILKNKVS